MAAAAGPAGGLGLLDPLAPAFRADPYPAYRRLRETAPLARQDAGFWLVSRHADCQAVLRDPRFGHGDGTLLTPGLGLGGGPGLLVAPGGRRVRSFLRLDPPDHTRLRNLVSKAFTARTVERLRPRVEGLAEELLDAAGGGADLVEALAFPLPVTVICELLGVPAADQPMFAGWSRDLARNLDPEFLLPPELLDRRERSALEFAAYFHELARERRRAPGDDLLSALVTVSDREGRLSHAELLATCMLLLVAGHETTVNLIGNGALALLRHPGQLTRLRAGDGTLAASAVEELLRYDSPVQLTARVALDDAEVGGTTVPRGESLLLLVGGANRDPAAFPDPDRLDLGRAPNRHLSFGAGIHFCLGAPLARLEGQVALRALARRAPALALTAEPEVKDSLVLRGLASLPVRLR